MLVMEMTLHMKGPEIFAQSFAVKQPSTWRTKQIPVLMVQRMTLKYLSDLAMDLKDLVPMEFV